LKWRKKELPHSLIKKKRVDQLIYGNRAKHRYKLDHEGIKATPETPKT
jgi:hypothetical protein